MRFFKKMYANLLGYFWLPCPICEEYFGGFEIGVGSVQLAKGKTMCCCKACDFDAGIIAGKNNRQVFISPKAIKYLDN